MYKNLITLAFILIFLSTPLFAQKGFSELGLKAGLNIRDLGGPKAQLYALPGYHIGLYREYVFSSLASLQPELLISLQGAAVDVNRDVRLNYTYLNLPIMGKYYFLENFNIEIGPQIGYLLFAKERDDFGSYNIINQVKKFDLSAAFGFSYKYQNRFGLTLRYTMGFTNTSTQNVMFDRRLTNRVYQASLSYVL